MVVMFILHTKGPSGLKHKPNLCTQANLHTSTFLSVPLSVPLIKEQIKLPLVEDYFILEKSGKFDFFSHI